MKKARVELLRELTEVNGVPGFESRVAEVMRKHVEGVADEVSSDNLGSLIAMKEGAAARPRVMLAGHMDEIGFMVKLVTEEGFIRFAPLGGWFDQVLLGQRVTIETSKGPVPGVIGCKAPHLLPADQRNKVVTKDAMFIDVGASDKKQATGKFGIRPGDAIVPVSPFTIMADPDRMLAKAWDDRVGVALAIETLQALKSGRHPNTVYAVGTVQEEVGLRGASTSVSAVDPDVAIVLETGIAGDTPDVKPEESDLKLGGGVGIYVLEGSAIPNLRLRDLTIELCEENKLDYQLTVLSAGGTDAGRIHIHARGVPSIVLGVPTRHIHSHAGIISGKDYETTLKLTVALCRALDEKTVKSLRP
ncbi:MAG: M42 family metallopeptidase [Armatimonadetes bacterium]|nr:M42 family metallopeptidase [Armatimonadota bacterium]